MLFYAPAELRRWRRTLVPLLWAAAVLAFVAILLLPPFEEADAANAVAMTVATLSLPLLMLLLNGEPLPPRAAFTSTSLDPAAEISFVARYTVASAKRAQSDFWRRSIRELRLGSTIMPPLFFAFATVFLAKSGGDSPTAGFFAVFTLLAATSPFVYFLSGRQQVANQARRFPERLIRMSREGIAVGRAGDALAWSNVARVWEFDEHLTLVLDPYLAVQLPKADLSEAARRLIAESTPAPS